MNEEQLRTLNISSPKDRFIEAYTTAISRQGSKELLDWMLKTDFFTAPASSKFHSAYEGGLCDHSLNVYNVMIDRYNDGKPDESFAIVALLHDLCKAQFYKLGSRNVKNETTGAWEKVPFYTIDDKFPFGHGEKSVFLIERFMRLKVEEAIAIRWHMGGFDDAARGGSFAINGAFERYPLAVKLHISDIEATYLMENTPQ
ncbi:MAG: hydrolase [Eubacteriales bacterium]